MADKKAFLLRVDPGVWAAIERLAQAELRSVNAEIEFLLRDALSAARHRAEARAAEAPKTPRSRTADIRPARARGTR